MRLLAAFCVNGSSNPIVYRCIETKADILMPSQLICLHNVLLYQQYIETLLYTLQGAYYMLILRGSSSVNFPL